MRKSHIIEAHVRAQLIRHKVTKEGEHLPFFQTELKVRDKVSTTFTCSGVQASTFGSLLGESYALFSLRTLYFVGQ